MFALLLLLQVAAVPAPTSRLIAVATILIPVAYIGVLLVKQAFPSISGGWAVLFNFVVSALGFVIALPQAQWFTMTTLMALAVTVAGAAGIHGTVKSLSTPAIAPTVPQPVPVAEVPRVQSAVRKPPQREDLP